MADESSTRKNTSLDPKQISAWISLGATILGLLTGLVTATGSIHNPVDTVLIFISVLALILCATTFFAVHLVGLCVWLFGEDSFNWPITLVITGILIAVIGIPLGISAASDMVKDSPDALGITFLRFLGVGVIVLTGWLMYSYVLVPKSREKEKGTF